MECRSQGPTARTQALERRSPSILTATLYATIEDAAEPCGGIRNAESRRLCARYLNLPVRTLELTLSFNQYLGKLAPFSSTGKATCT